MGEVVGTQAPHATHAAHALWVAGIMTLAGKLSSPQSASVCSG